MRIGLSSVILSLILLSMGFPAESKAAGAEAGVPTVWILTTDGVVHEGELLSGATLGIDVDGQKRALAWSDFLSLNTGSAASTLEKNRIDADLKSLTEPNLESRRAAIAELGELGLPAITPLLAILNDTDLREPNPGYRLFERIIPGYADASDRTLDFIRLKGGRGLRGKISPTTLQIKTVAGKTESIQFGDIRRLAVLQATIDRMFEVHSIRHSTQIEFLDTGVVLAGLSEVEETAQGYVRLCYKPDLDDWSADADGLKKPANGKTTNLTDGFPFAALVGRVGPNGGWWLAGRHANKSGLGSGRLYFAVNDNSHWQNNIGSFRVALHVTNAYDMGDPQ
jgi:hypothetical protein